MQLSHQSLSIQGWIHEYDQQQYSPQIHQVVNQIINRKQQSQKRSVSLCQSGQEQNKSNLIDYSKYKSQILRPPIVPTNQNKIQELKKVMESLQHNKLTQI